MNNTRNCEICGKELKIFKERIVRSKGNPTSIYTSDDGIYFEEGDVWFCNCCYDEMTEHIFKENLNETN